MIQDPIRRLEAIMARLREENGCPWDREQTHRSLRPYLIEEAYEVVEAIDLEDPAKIREELGDVLLQVVFHAQVSREKGGFNLDDIANEICEKMVRRHPHVFGDVEVEGVAGVLDNWQRIKQEEKGGETPKTASALAGITQGLPALQRAEKIQSRAAKSGFDWPSFHGPLDKVSEELNELLEVWRGRAQEKETPDLERMEEEFGDVLFSLVNVARFLGVHPELALNRTVDKFIRRFQGMERLAAEEGKTLSSMDLLEMDGLWDKMKEQEVRANRVK